MVENRVFENTRSLIMCDLNYELLIQNTLDVMHCEENLDVKMS